MFLDEEICHLALLLCRVVETEGRIILFVVVVVAVVATIKLFMIITRVGFVYGRMFSSGGRVRRVRWHN